MKVVINKRDGPARIGKLTVDNKEIITPNILFVNTNRFKSPEFAEILSTNNVFKSKKLSLKVLKDIKGKKHELTVSDFFVYQKDVSKELHEAAIKIYKKKDLDCYVVPGNKDAIDVALKNNPADIFIIANASQLLLQPRNFVDFIVELREKIGYEKLIYLPSVGEPANFALFAYLGIDLFDSVSAILAARNDVLLFSNGAYNKNTLFEIPCSCPSCNKFQGKPYDMSFQRILNHNYYKMLNELKHVRNAISNGDLRGLVEARVKSSPTLTAMLRNLDRNHYSFLEERTPVSSKSKLLATSKESLLRPEIKRFQERVMERYRKPEITKILLLLPCSARKPYSFSKSHRFFREMLNSSGNPFAVHEVIVTSPMGIVPRELELIYPASSYDIPVTGVWDEDEKKMIRDLLTNYLNANKYDTIIAHLPREILEFTEDILKKPDITCIDDPTSDKSLDKLLQTLKKNVNKYDKVKFSDRAKEDVKGFASYQFGKKIAEKLLKDCVIRGKYPNQKITHNDTQLGMVIEERGLISLTLNGAERLVDSGKYWVEIYDDFILKGSVFAPGIKDADDGIRINDEVIITKKGKLCAIGVAQMNGKEMKESLHGEAVKVRHIA